MKLVAKNAVHKCVSPLSQILRDAIAPSGLWDSVGWIATTRVVSTGEFTQAHATDVVMNTSMSSLLAHEWVATGPTDIVLQDMTPSPSPVSISGTSIRLIDSFSTGMATIKLTTGGYSRLYTCYLYHNGGNVSSTFVEWLPSAGQRMSDAITAMLSGKSPATALRMFSTADHANQQYVRNPLFWATGVAGLSAIPVYYSNTRCFQKGGVLISPRHLLTCWHYKPTVGSVVRWLGSDGRIEERSIADSRNPVKSSSGGISDFGVHLLSGDPLPSTVGYVRVVSTLEALANINNGDKSVPYPMVVANQDRSFGVVRLLVTPQTENQVVMYYVSGRSGLPDSQASFYVATRDLDSGSPQFLLINGELVLLTVTTSYNWSGGLITECISTINSDMSTLGGGYQLTLADPSLGGN